MMDELKNTAKRWKGCVSYPVKASLSHIPTLGGVTYKVVVVYEREGGERFHTTRMFEYEKDARAFQRSAIRSNRDTLRMPPIK